MHARLRHRRRWHTAAATALLLGLVACGGSDDDAPTTGNEGTTPPLPAATAPPASPVPKFTYAPDPQVCAWVDAHVKPFQWPATTVGPRTWPEVARVITHAHPVRDATGTPYYTVESNDWVLSAHYAGQAQALGVPPATFADPADGRSVWRPHTRLWAQQLACTHDLALDSFSDTRVSAYMPDEVAARLAHEQYAVRISQTDLCAPSDFVFTGMQPPPLPPECDAPAR